MKSNENSFQVLLKKPRYVNLLKAFVIFILGIILTAIATFYAHIKIESDADHEFASRCTEIKISTQNRIRSCEQLLGTCSALFSASDSVSRQEWKTFNDISKYKSYLPGIQGVGYCMIVNKSQIKNHIKSIQESGFPKYKIIPEGDRETYSSIIYFEPFSGANLNSLGFDMLTDSTTRHAMEMSRDSDLAAISGKVMLGQNSGDQESGVLFYVPVYRKEMPKATVEQRRSAIKGWVFSTYHMDDLINDILSRYFSRNKEVLGLQIYDETVSDHSLLYDNHIYPLKTGKDVAFRKHETKVKAYHKKWILIFTIPKDQNIFFHSLIAIILLSGVSISLLLLLLTLSLLNTRDKAQSIALELTHELKESEERIREVLENSTDASYKRNLKTQSYDYLSPSYTRISGYPLSDIKNLSIKSGLTFIHPDDVIEVNRILSHSMSDESSGSYQLEYRFMHKDGQYRWFQDRYTIVRDNQNQPLALIGSVSDVTNRKQMEEALKDERLLLRTVIDIIPDSIYCLDLECRKTLANLTDLRYMGARSEGEVIGKNDFDFFPKEIAEKFFEVDNAVIQTGKPLLNVEEYMVEKNGDIRWLLSSKIPMFNNDGQIIGLLGYGRDITGRKMAEEEIKAKNEELQKLNSAKDKFFSIIAHDLRSPFNGFLGLTQMMAEDLPTMTLEEIQSIAVSMRSSATTLYRLLENLLQWSTMQQNRISFNPVLIKLNSIICDSIALVIQSANNKGIEIMCLIEGEIEVFADLNMLQTVLRNLVSNSIKFTPKGGKIDISALIKEDGLVEIAIRDSGIGMNKETLNGLFKLDVNTSRKGTDGESSTGLGLIICKDFIEKNGGEIWAESQEGKGSTFYFTLKGNQ